MQGQQMFDVTNAARVAAAVNGTGVGGLGLNSLGLMGNNGQLCTGSFTTTSFHRLPPELQAELQMLQPVIQISDPTQGQGNFTGGYKLFCV